MHQKHTSKRRSLAQGVVGVTLAAAGTSAAAAAFPQYITHCCSSCCCGNHTALQPAELSSSTELPERVQAARHLAGGVGAGHNL